jgi:hypothetical protein
LACAACAWERGLSCRANDKVKLGFSDVFCGSRRAIVIPVTIHGSLTELGRYQLKSTPCSLKSRDLLRGAPRHRACLADRAHEQSQLAQILHSSGGWFNVSDLNPLFLRFKRTSKHTIQRCILTHCSAMKLMPNGKGRGVNGRNFGVNTVKSEWAMILSVPLA